MIDEADFDYSKFGYSEQNLGNGVVLSKLNVSDDNNKIGFKKGYYRIISAENFFVSSKEQLEFITSQLVHQLDELLEVCDIKKNQTVLVCGLGNIDITADSLGTNVCKKVLSTRLLNNTLIRSNICSISPNVQSVTGIETFDIVSGIAKSINAKLIILVDSLLTNNIKRIGHSFQLSTCGIVPGGAIRKNKEISYETLGIKCITIGVPFMLDLKSISNKINKSTIVSPKDINEMIKKCSSLISDSINILFNPNLKKEEICELLNPF